jgi:hypothetical protein
VAAAVAAEVETEVIGAPVVEEVASMARYQE